MSYYYIKSFDAIYFIEELITTTNNKTKMVLYHSPEHLGYQYVAQGQRQRASRAIFATNIFLYICVGKQS